jgi:hypothetical protein
LQIVRTPLDKNVGTALNVLTLGQWEKSVAKSGYDKIFHLFLMINLVNGPTLIFEKNETVRFRQVDFNKDVNNKTEMSTVEKYASRKLTVLQLFQNTLDSMGKDLFYTYDAFQNNCQAFVKNILGANGVLTERNLRFIDQDAESIAKSLPSYTKPLASRITTLARKGREILGLGLPIN